MSAENTERSDPTDHTETTDDGRTWYEDAAALLEAPLVGLERRRTAAAIAYLLGFAVLFGLSRTGVAVAIDGAPLDTTTTYFDTVSMVLIALATATITLLPLAYAAWNGGPVLAFGGPLVPVFLADVATGQYVLGLDAAIALTVGAAASALAMLAIDVRQRASCRPWRYQTVDRQRLTVVTALVVVAAVGVARFVRTVPGYALEWYAPFGGLWLATGAICCSYWYARLRARDSAPATGRDRTNA